MFSWYKYLIVSLFFPHPGFWSGNLFLIAPFPDLCLLVPFSRTVLVEMIEPLCMPLVYKRFQIGSTTAFYAFSMVSSFIDIYTESTKSHTGFCNSDSDRIINVHCPGESASQVGEFINNFGFCPFTVVVSR